jgi:hypothetical protein
LIVESGIIKPKSFTSARLMRQILQAMRTQVVGIRASWFETRGLAALLTMRVYCAPRLTTSS